MGKHRSQPARNPGKGLKEVRTEIVTEAGSHCRGKKRAIDSVGDRKLAKEVVKCRADATLSFSSRFRRGPCTPPYAFGR